MGLSHLTSYSLRGRRKKGRERGREKSRRTGWECVLLFVQDCLLFAVIVQTLLEVTMGLSHLTSYSLRGRRKKGRERGREKSTKEGKGKGAPAIRAGVFVIRPPFSQLIR